MTDTTGPAAAPLTDGLADRLAAIGVALDAFAATGSDPVPRRAAWQAALGGPLPERGVGADAVLAELADVVVPNGTRLMEPGWWGYITNGPTTVPLVASVAAAVAAPQRYTLTAFNLLEEQSLEWLAELCGLEPHLRGVYSSGGSVANLVALGAARQHACEERGVDAGAEGLGGLRLVVYASDETHHTVQRAAGVLGIGRSSVRRVGTDAQLRMRPDLLDEAITADVAAGVVPMAVVGTAGTTNTGSIDDLRALGEVAHRYGAWFHVDGAYGLPGILDDRVAARYDGLELADSAIVDPHKWLGAPIGIGATFVRDRSLLHRAFTQEPAAYLETDGGDGDRAESSLDSMGTPYADLGVELSAQSRGVVVWSILRELGRAGVTARVRADDDHARRIADLARRHPRLELLLEPVLSICCFRYVPGPDHDADVVNAEILRRLHRGSAFIPSSTRVRGQYALRPCFINPRTTTQLVDAFVDAVVTLGDEIVAGG
ncbi:MAG: aminotransferase class V-fold PLP-dependent enzyme [Actinomycetales bacterium]|nr:aminotransferase class V-fold PLP-dependent enzyme [Actinomycetales bacterium]